MLAYAATGHSQQTRHRGRGCHAHIRVVEHGPCRAPGTQWVAQRGRVRRGACPPHPDRDADTVNARQL